MGAVFNEKVLVKSALPRMGLTLCKESLCSRSDGAARDARDHRLGIGIFKITVKERSLLPSQITSSATSTGVIQVIRCSSVGSSSIMRVCVRVAEICVVNH